MFKNRHGRAKVQNTQLMDDIYGSGLKPQGDPLVPQRSTAWSSTTPLHAPVGPTDVDWDALEAEERSRSALETAAHLAGRAIFGGFFVYNGINHFRNREMLAAYAGSKKVPAADVAVIASGLLMLAGGVSILTGTRPKIGAAAVGGFLLGVSPTMHAYWNETEPQQRMNDMVNFTKNMALIGGALLAAGHPEPWPVAIRA